MAKCTETPNDDTTNKGGSLLSALSGFVSELDAEEATDDTFFGIYKDHTISVHRDRPGSDWYFIVTAPDGSYSTDGWWRDSAQKTMAEAIMESIAGAGLDR